MTTTLDRPRTHTPVLNFLSAVFIGCAFYSVLFFAFTFDVNVNKNNGEFSPRKLADIIMLPIEKSPTFHWQKNLIANLELLDPTVMVLPNPSYGFSTIRNHEFERSEFAFEPLNYDIDYTIRQQNKPPSLSGNSGKIYPVISGIPDIIKGHAANDFHDNYPEFKEMVYWTTGDGQIVPEFNATERVKIVDNIDSLSSTKGPTTLRVNLGTDTARVRLLQSSGNRKLDAFAVSYIRGKLLNPQNRDSIISVLQPEQQKEVTILAHWRFLDKIQEKIDINSDINLYDWYRF